MAALDADIVRGMAGGAGLILMYGLYAWRIFKSNPGDRFMESASVTLMIFVARLVTHNISPAHIAKRFKQVLVLMVIPRSIFWAVVK
jgi:hypothetical protein